MNAKSTAYTVSFKIIEYRSTPVLASSPDEAIAKAQKLHRDEPDSDLFEVSADLDLNWHAEEVQP